MIIAQWKQLSRSPRPEVEFQSVKITSLCVCVCVRWDNAVKVSVRLSRRGDRLRRRREPKKQLTGKGLAGFKWAFNLGPTTWFFASF